MFRLRHISAPAAVAFTAALGTASADLLDTFDPPNPNVTSTQGGSAPGPTVAAGGPTGNFLRLTDTVNNQNNRYTYDRTDVGAYETINAQWDYRAASGGAAADGAAFLFLPTGAYGISGDGPPLVAEEPNLAGTFAVGIDLHPAGSVNDVSFHWDGFEQTNANIPTAIVDLDNGLFHRFDVALQRVGNGTNASLTVTPDIHGTPGAPTMIINQAMSFLPYEYRNGLAGRTGGLNVAQDIDNVSVAPTNPFAGGLPTAPTGNLHQDFDSAGATGYVARTHNTRTATIFRPGPLLNAADGGSDGAFLRLIHDGVNSNNNSITFNRAADGGITNKSQTVSMDMRMTSAGNPADGVGVIFLPTAQYGDRGAVNPVGEFEQGAAPANSLKVGFDLYNGENDLVIHAGAAEVARIDVDPGVVDLNSGNFNRYHITFEPTVGGGNVVIETEADINGVPGARTEIGSVFLPGAGSFDYRVQIGGRTGGAFHNADLDNITSTMGSVAQSSTTSQTFEAGGIGQSGFKAYKFGAGSAPSLVDDGGNQVLRLIHDGQNSQTNTVAFDLADSGVVTAETNQLVSSFEYRATSPDSPADGFSWRVLPTATYGTENMGTPGQGAEEPNIAGVLAVGFDFYNSADGVNDVSLHYGTEILNVRLDPNTQINLDDGNFHLVAVNGIQSGADLVVDVAIDGVVYLDDVVVSNFNFEDSRLEFAGRSGGLNMTVDLDNVDFAFIPEPSAAILSLLSAAALLIFRRRRR